MSSPSQDAATQTAAGRGDRRRARTRQKLIAAARGFLQAPGYTERSIADITDTADVGLGSFYNHFSSKEELYAAAVHEVLDEHGALLDATGPTENIDPAERVAVAIRSTGRLVMTNPEMAHILATQGMAILDADTGLMPRARRVLRAGIKQGRFTDADPELLLASIIGSLMAILHILVSAPDSVDESWCDDLAERLLVLCGVPADEAKELAHAPPLPRRSLTPCGRRAARDGDAPLETARDRDRGRRAPLWSSSGPWSSSGARRRPL